MPSCLRGSFDNGRTKRVTLCRDARSERPLYQRLQHRDCNGDGRSVECLVGGRPLYQRLQHRDCNGDGRPPTRYYPSVPTEIGVTAFDEWNCRADVACVGADLRVRPKNRLRSGEDGRTHRSAPTVGAPTPPSGSPEEKSTELPKREKNFAFYLHVNLESTGLLVSL